MEPSKMPLDVFERFLSTCLNPEFIFVAVIFFQLLSSFAFLIFFFKLRREYERSKYHDRVFLWSFVSTSLKVVFGRVNFCRNKNPTSSFCPIRWKKNWDQTWTKTVKFLMMTMMHRLKLSRTINEDRLLWD